MKLILSLAVFVCGVLVGAYGEMATTKRRGRSHGGTTTVSPEYDLSKLREQNATRVVQMNATQWVKWRTYNVTDLFRGNPLQCENFKVGEKRTAFNYSLQYNYRSGRSWKTINESLILGYLDLRPLPPNDMFFGRTPLGFATHNYVLYSNYVNCTILRIPMPNQGEKHCDLWMANMTVSQEPPKPCLEKYYEYCNTTQNFTVYFPNCGAKNSDILLK
uniref:Lipocalin n=1 Tax=Ixodes ricinus TaxID=34613 RepID=B7ZDG4_IXORI|nr:lipocalin [Ixodes ricinus]